MWKHCSWITYHIKYYRHKKSLSTTTILCQEETNLIFPFAFPNGQCQRRNLYPPGSILTPPENSILKNKQNHLPCEILVILPAFSPHPMVFILCSPGPAYLSSGPPVCNVPHTQLTPTIPMDVCALHTHTHTTHMDSPCSDFSVPQYPQSHQLFSLVLHRHCHTGDFITT